MTATTETPPTPEELLAKTTLSVSEFAAVSGLGLHRAYEYVRTRKVRSLRSGSRYLVLTSSVRELLGMEK